MTHSRAKYLLIAVLVIVAATFLAPMKAMAETGTLYVNSATGTPLFFPAGHGLSGNEMEELAREFTLCRGTQCVATHNVDYDTVIGATKYAGGKFIHFDGNGRPLPGQSQPGTDGSIGGDGSTWANSIFNYAMGRSSGSCLSCDFVAFFMIGLTDFSQAIFQYFLAGFKMIAPMAFLIWLAHRVSRLMIHGGENGRDFLYDFLKKSTLFFFVWAITTANAGPPVAGVSNMLWKYTGPAYLDFAFKLSSEVRDASITAGRTAGIAGNTGSGAPFGCSNTAPVTGGLISSRNASYIRSGLEVACTTERTHMVGMASGVAVIFSTIQPSGDTSGNVVVRVLTGMMYNLVKLLAGLMLILPYALSAFWLVFLTLDIVVKALVFAAFSPALSLAFLFEPTRQFATNAIKGLAATAATAVTISIVSVLSFFMMSNVVVVYNAMLGTMGSGYASYAMTPILENDIITSFQIFLLRVQNADLGSPAIPLDLSTPWFYYMFLAGVSTFALGKKIIRMVEDLMMVQGESAMADQATRLAKAGMVLGGGVSLFAASKGSKFAFHTGAAGVAGAAGGIAHMANSPAIKNAGLAFAGNAIRTINPFAGMRDASGSGATKNPMSRMAEIKSLGEVGARAADLADTPDGG